MSKPYPVADADRLVRSLTRRLAEDAARVPDNRLTPTEDRLLAIAKYRERRGLFGILRCGYVVRPVGEAA